MVWERFWSNPTWGGEKKKSIFLLLFQALSSLGLELGFRNEVWVGLRSQVMLAQHPSMQQ